MERGEKEVENDCDDSCQRRHKNRLFSRKTVDLHLCLISVIRCRSHATNANRAIGAVCPDMLSFLRNKHMSRK